MIIRSAQTACLGPPTSSQKKLDHFHDTPMDRSAPSVFQAWVCILTAISAAKNITSMARLHFDPDHHKVNQETYMKNTSQEEYGIQRTRIFKFQGRRLNDITIIYISISQKKLEIRT
jgi:hypothetical protein